MLVWLDGACLHAPCLQAVTGEYVMGFVPLVMLDGKAFLALLLRLGGLPAPPSGSCAQFSLLGL